MPSPKPITLTQIDTEEYTSPNAPQPFVVVGSIPSTEPEIDPQEAPSIDATPADAAAVAADLQAVVDALIDAGVFTD